MVLDFDPDGLSAQEAARRLEQYGPNELPRAKPPPAWKLALSQLTHFFALLLWAAAVLALIGGLPPLAVAIVIIIVVNGAFAFVQEYKAGKAAEKLKGLLPRRAAVIRDGQRWMIDAAQLVPGDLVSLSPGDRISADLNLVEVHDISIDTSTFTGETTPETPRAGEIAYAGTYVVSGAALGVVVATGAATRLAEIAELTKAPREEPTPLSLELKRLVKVIAAIAVSVGVLFFVISLVLRRPLTGAFVFAVGVTVALVPEGLLPTITLSLASSAQKMAAQSALVRRLEAVESLGLTTVICTDKTGTLTRNEMSVVEIWTPEGEIAIEGIGYRPQGKLKGPDRAVSAARRAALAGALCSDGFAYLSGDEWLPQGDPTEVAIWVAALRTGIDLEKEKKRYPTRRIFPFDSNRRRMSVLAGDTLFVKGAPDSVLKRCRGDAQTIESASAVVESMADRGLRVLAVAKREAEKIADRADADAAETDLELLGLFGLEDLPRPEARSAIAACRSAGIKVVMVTGDHPKTALAVAQEVGMAPEGVRPVLGEELPPDDEALAEIVDTDGIVLARISPEQKFRIARVLKSKGHVVAMTGDGVNDAPALAEADVGVAMGKSGTDVARDAADLVLLDDNFATIVRAVERGRATYANIRRFLTYHLTDNVAELAPFVLWALSAGRIPLALGVLQILALDIGTDALPALALGVEGPGSGVMRQPPPRRHLVDAGVLLRAFAVLGLTEATVEMTTFLTVLLAGGWMLFGDPPDTRLLTAASGAAFAAVVFGQAANAFACRSARDFPWRLGLASNRPLVIAVAVEISLLVVLVLAPPAARVLEHSSPTALGWILAASAAPAVILVDSVQKFFSARRKAAK